MRTLLLSLLRWIVIVLFFGGCASLIAGYFWHQLTKITRARNPSSRAAQAGPLIALLGMLMAIAAIGLAFVWRALR